MKSIEVVKKRHIKLDDLVKVIAGDEKGKTGKVTQVITSTNKAIVEGLNIAKKHQKPSAKNPEGGIIEKELPIHISNLMLVDPKSGKPTRIGRKLNKDGKLSRYSKKTTDFIDKNSK